MRLCWKKVGIARPDDSGRTGKSRPTGPTGNDGGYAVLPTAGKNRKGESFQNNETNWYIDMVRTRTRNGNLQIKVDGDWHGVNSLILLFPQFDRFLIQDNNAWGETRVFDTLRADGGYQKTWEKTAIGYGG